jgi:Ca2+-binding EF-hand superfamily protein
MKSPAKSSFEAILVITVIIAFAIAPLASKAEETQKRGPVPFTEFDADGDGFVSEEEFNKTRSEHMAKMAEAGRPMKGAASAPAFADMDTDGDGMLDKDELRAGQKAQMKAMRGEGKGGSHGKMKRKHKGKGHAEDMKMPTFEDIDTDGDGSISREELAAHQASHHGEDR